MNTDEKSEQLHPSWQAHMGNEFAQPYMQALKAFLQTEKTAGKTIFPAGSLIFNAFKQTPFDLARVVIIGQDPYHGLNKGRVQAHGLSFSVPVGVPPPPSLINIFKELETDLGITMGNSGDLTPWAKQGVLLLNATLTVEMGLAGSHQNKGWERFTDVAISALNLHHEGLVFVLWGTDAQKKGAIIDTQKHLLLRSSHPSPLSAYRGFFGSRPFSKINAYLMQKGEKPVCWEL